MKKIIVLLLVFILTSCSGISPRGKGSEPQGEIEANNQTDRSGDYINEEGIVIGERVEVPEGFERVSLERGSFGEYLRNLPLKSHGTRVKYFDGRIKPQEVHEAVIDIDVGGKDLQQCADAAMRLRAEYLYSRELYDKIHFNFTNGFRADYMKWAQGSRISVQGNKAFWTGGGKVSTDYQSFRKYLDIVFSYAGTLSLSKELNRIAVEEMRVGDVFIMGGSPGHCVIVVDMAENKNTGEKLFMLAQSYMPAQDIHILKNPNDSSLSPWYPLNFGETLTTPEWNFTKAHLMRFPD